MNFRGCWSCGSHGPCLPDCECAKCIDPEGYEDWRGACPEEYDQWLECQQLEHDEECDCPSCRGEW